MNIDWHNEKRKIKELVPYVANPRQITDKQAKDLKASLDKFGLAEPITINTDNTIIGGHQRKKILESLIGVDPDYEVDVWVPDRELSIDEARELNVRLNKNVAGWDFDTLANNFELDDLLDWGFEKSDLDLDLWMPEPEDDPGAQVDRAEELREIWGVETGQLWQLGEHRLICGDCTDKAVVERVMGGEKADLCLTDPPYATGGKSEDYDIGLDELKLLIDDFLPIALDVSDRILLTPGNAYQFYYPKPTWVLAWFVNAGVGANPWGFTFWNAVFAYGKDPYLQKGMGSRPDAFVKTEASEKSPHPTSKPVGVWEWLVERGSVDIGDIVYDPFLGSGTTLIACERLNRKCRAVEISPAYVAVAIQRWVDMTGGEPVLV